MIRLLVGCGFFIAFLSAQAENTAQVKTNLQKLNLQINQLQTKLRTDNNTRIQLTQKLNSTLAETIKVDHELLRLENIVIEKNKTIAELNSKINNLQVNLKKYQMHLAENVRAWQRIAPLSPLKWILHPENASQLRRHSMYQKYLLAATHQLMQRVNATQEILSQQQAHLIQEISEQKHAHQQWLKRKRILTQNTSINTQKLSTLNRSLISTADTLKNHQKNQLILANLLGSLTKNSVLQTQKPISIMQGQLNNPVSIDHIITEKSHQGLIFFAPEGTNVNAIYPGKIVFADWLNGYGYLLIIDHGWGFMSLYANNKTLLKHKGDIVRVTEKIALVGHSGTLQKSGLYFELRHHGKPVPSSKWWAPRSV